MVSASAVDPRMSAKRSVPSISAPPWWRERYEKHELHMFGFALDGNLPMSRMSGEPTPRKGAAQILQRGSEGMCLKTRRP